VEDGYISSPYVLSYQFNKGSCTLQHTPENTRDPAPRLFLNLSYDDEAKLASGVEMALWFLKGAQPNLKP
jgi:hypothetical protein